jgi:hypothetical protein
MIEDAKKRLETPKKEEPEVTPEQPETEARADDAEGTTAETGEEAGKDAEETKEKEPEADSEEQVQIKDRARRLLKALDVDV